MVVKPAPPLTAEHGSGVQGLQRRERFDTRLQKLPQEADGHSGLAVGALAAAHTVGQRQTSQPSGIKNGALIAAVLFAGLGPQQGSGAAGQVCAAEPFRRGGP